MKALVVGSGAREHALVWKLAASKNVDQIFAAPGNAGTALLGTNWPVAATSRPELVERALREHIDLAVIGPEAALAAGVADALRGAGIAVFGPNSAGARLETSKAYAKQFMDRHGIPTARHREAHDFKQAERALGHFPKGVVLKADGLAAGKGVVVCPNADDARAVLAQWYGERKLPGGGTTIVIEEQLEGREVSIMAVLDGQRYCVLAGARDYKRAGDGDSGPNTGGMGAYSPASDVLDEAKLELVRQKVLEPALVGLKSEGIDYRGCLYAGLMMTKRGPMVLEFNARFGDPETEVVLPRLESDLFELLQEAANGSLRDDTGAKFSARACVGVVLTSQSYPQRSDPVAGLPVFEPLSEDVIAFWGGSTPAAGTVNASGGRVLTVCALGDDMAIARKHAYDSAERYVSSLPPGLSLRYRSDIGEHWAAAIR